MEVGFRAVRCIDRTFGCSRGRFSEPVRRACASVAPDGSLAAIRDALIDEELAGFERGYQDTLVATETLGLTKALGMLRNYHRIA